MNSDFDMAHLYGLVDCSKGLGFRYGIPLWACGMIMLLSAIIYITIKVVKNIIELVFRYGIPLGACGMIWL